MNKIRHELIRFIANGQPVLLNWLISLSKETTKIVAYIPPKGELLTLEEAGEKACLVPLVNIKY